MSSHDAWRAAMRRRLTAVGAVVLLLIGVSTGVWAATGRTLLNVNQASDARPNSCATQEIFLGARGSGETDALGPTVQTVYRDLKLRTTDRGIALATDWAEYPAVSVPDALTAGILAVGKSAEYDNSYHQGVSVLETALLHWSYTCPGARFVLAGYSQGADVVAGTLGDLNPERPAEAAIIDKIDAVALIADPGYNPTDTGIDALSGRLHGGLLRLIPSDHHGLRHLPGWAAPRVRSWCATSDPVCDLDLTRYASCAPFALSLSMTPALAACLKNEVGRDIGVHTSYPTTPYVIDAANWLADHVGQPGGQQGSPPAGTVKAPTGPTTGPPCEKLLSDVTVPDGSTLRPNEQVTKTWMLANCGSAAWNATTASLVSGSGAPASFLVPATPPGSSAYVSLPFTAPAANGHYRWTYRLGNAAGAAHGTFWLDFNVAGQPAPAGPAAPESRSCTAFVSDVSVPDGTTVSPGQDLTKSWRLRNCGTTDWSGLHATRVDGSFGPVQFTVPITKPGSTTTVSTEVTAPTTPGHYRTTYRLVDYAGTLAAHSFWVDVNVQGPEPQVSNSPAPASNRYGVTSYDRLASGASHSEWYQAWQDFTAASSALTRLQINVGDTRWAPGPIGVTTTIRLCLDSACNQQLGAWRAQINNYGTTTTEIGDFHVTQGTTYYLRYDRPDTAHSWAVYYWGPGTYNNLSAAVYGYNP
jgi:hypothetical protein